MITLKGEKVFLRALEPEDLEVLFSIENEESLWEVSNTQTPFSKYLLQQYIENSHRDIYEVKQLRLAICNSIDTTVLGFIDLFDFEPKHNRAGVGIVIFSEENKNKGFASEALKLLCNYAFVHLNMHQLYANITQGNNASIKLFEHQGFKKIGIKEDWIRSNGKFKNEILFQLIQKHVL